MRWLMNHHSLMGPKAYSKSRMKKLSQITVEKVGRRRARAASRLGREARRHMLRISKRMYIELLMPAFMLSNRAQLRIRRERRQRKRWRTITISLLFWGTALELIDLPPPRLTSCKVQKLRLFQRANFRTELEFRLVSLTLVVRNTVWLLLDSTQTRVQELKDAQAIPIFSKTNVPKTAIESHSPKWTLRILQNVELQITVFHYKKQIPRWAQGSRCPQHRQRRGASTSALALKPIPKSAPKATASKKEPTASSPLIITIYPEALARFLINKLHRIWIPKNSKLTISKPSLLLLIKKLKREMISNKSWTSWKKHTRLPITQGKISELSLRMRVRLLLRNRGKAASSRIWLLKRTVTGSSRRARKMSW